MRSAPLPPPAVTITAVDPLSGTGTFLWTWRLCLYLFLAIGAALGGPVIGTAAVIAAFALPLTDYAGGVWCLFQAAGVVVQILLVPVVTLPLGWWLAEGLNAPLLPAMVGAFGVVLVITTLVVGRLGWICSRGLCRRRYLYVLNRSLGALGGAGAGATAVVLFCWFFGIFGAALSRYCEAIQHERPSYYRVLRPMERLQVWMLGDPTAQQVAAANPLYRVSKVEQVAAIAEFAADQHIYWQMVARGELDDVLSDPAIAPRYHAFKSDTRMKQAVEDRDLRAILMSDHFHGALADNEFCAALARHWPEVRHRVSASQIGKARLAAERFGPQVEAGIERATRRAEEFGVYLP